MLALATGWWRRSGDVRYRDIQSAPMSPHLEGPSDGLCTLGRGGGSLAHWGTVVRTGRGTGVVARGRVKALAVSSVGVEFNFHR